MSMNYVLIAKEQDGFEIKNYNVVSVGQDEVETLHDVAISFLQLAKEQELNVGLYLETYLHGEFVEYSKYEEYTDEFVAISTNY